MHKWKVKYVYSRKRWAERNNSLTILRELVGLPAERYRRIFYFMARPIKNNADYFSHDADMRNDPKVKALRRKFRLEGYAVWCMLLESITDSENFRLRYDLDIIAGDYDLEPHDLEAIIGYCLSLGLLQMDEVANEIYCLQLEKRLEPLLSKRKRDRTMVIDSDNTQSKVKESKGYIDTIGSGQFSVTIKKVFAKDKIKKIHDLKTYFEQEGKLIEFIDKGWVHFQPFIELNAGRDFNDSDHLYSAFRKFCVEYKPPTRAPNKYENAEYYKSLWTKEAWEEEYRIKLLKDNDFRKHFGYDELRISKTMGDNGKG